MSPPFLHFFLILVLLEFSLCLSGDTRLTEVFERAVAESKNDILAFWKKKTVPFVSEIDCPLLQPTLGYITTNSTFGNSIKSGGLSIGCSTDNPFMRDTQSLMTLIVDRMGKYYNEKIQARYVLYPSDTELFDALAKGKVELTLPSVYPRSVVNLSKRFDEIKPLCSFGAIASDFFYDSKDYSSFDLISKALTSKPSLYVVAPSFGICTYLKSMFGFRCEYRSDAATNIDNILQMENVTAVVLQKSLVKQSYKNVFSQEMKMPFLSFARTEQKFVRLLSHRGKRWTDSGNNMLRKMLDQTISSLQQTGMKSKLRGLSFIGDCYKMTASESFDKLKGVVKQIVEDKKMTIGYIRTQVPQWLDTEKFSENDLVIKEEDSIIEKTFVSHIIGVWTDFQIKRIVYDTYEKALSALDYGDVDVLSAATPTAISNDYAPSCAVFGVSPSVLFVERKCDGEKNLQELNEFIGKHRNKKILASSEFAKSLASTLLPAVPSSQIRVVTDTNKLYKMLEDDETFVASLFESLVNPPASFAKQLRSIQPDTVILPTSFIVRRDGKSIPFFERDSSIILIVFAILATCFAISSFVGLNNVFTKSYEHKKDDDFSQKDKSSFSFSKVLGIFDKIASKFERKKKPRKPKRDDSVEKEPLNSISLDVMEKDPTRQVDKDEAELNYVPPNFVFTDSDADLNKDYY